MHDRERDGLTVMAEHLLSGGDWKNRLGQRAILSFWFSLQRGRCWWCGERMQIPPSLRPDRLYAIRGGMTPDMADPLNATIEHLLPPKAEHRNSISQIRAAHRECNNKRRHTDDLGN